MSRAVASKPMCCVTIGFTELLLPADAGLKLVGLLQGAVGCIEAYDGSLRHEFRVSPGPLRVSLQMVTPGQIVMPPGVQPQPGALPTKPLRLK